MIETGETGDLAFDHCHRWRNPIRPMQESGIQSNRCAIARTRILSRQQAGGHGTEA
jgi:hypothetical protein